MAHGDGCEGQDRATGRSHLEGDDVGGKGGWEGKTGRWGQREEWSDVMGRWRRGGERRRRG